MMNYIDCININLLNDTQEFKKKILIFDTGIFCNLD